MLFNAIYLYFAMWYSLSIFLSEWREYKKQTIIREILVIGEVKEEKAEEWVKGKKQCEEVASSLFK